MGKRKEFFTKLSASRWPKDRKMLNLKEPIRPQSVTGTAASLPKTKLSSELSALLDEERKKVEEYKAMNERLKIKMFANFTNYYIM
jgi:hypothetical protein